LVEDFVVVVDVATIDDDVVDKDNFVDDSIVVGIGIVCIIVFGMGVVVFVCTNKIVFKE
jgi:hypothetical protein